MRIKANDLTNQAVQCNQLGSPIIFIDSCETLISVNDLQIAVT